MSKDLNTQWNEISDELKKEILKARRRGLNRAVVTIKNATKKLLRSLLPSSTSKSKKYGDSLIDGVRVTKYKENSLIGDAIASVHVMGVRTKTSGTFRLRFFEGGTTSRYIGTHKRKSKKGNVHTVMGHYVGRIKSYGFLRKGVAEKIGEVPSIIDREILKAIEKCNKNG